jgi:TolB-like protein/Tfp pilus assembly protein PilF
MPANASVFATRRGVVCSNVGDARPAPLPFALAPAPRTRLESWKAIASHFGRDVTTVRRWERREGLPIHRLFHDKLGTVYAFTDELDAWWTARTPAPGSGPDGAAVRPSPSSDDSRTEDAGSGRGRWWMVGTAVAASAGAALLAWLTLAPGGASPAAERSVEAADVIGVATGTAAASIVVLPLTAAGAVEPSFVDGMTTAINAELASFRSLKVIAPASARRVRERGDRDSATIGQTLGVGWILDGTVERAPSRVRLALRLNTAGSGDAVWTARFDRPIEQILELQAEVGRAVAGKMLPPDVVAREAARARRVGPVDEGVYETYLRGEFHEDQLNPASLSRAVELFTQAVTEDPGFAPAWAGLARANLLQESWGDAAQGARAEDVRRATLRALALDPHLAAAHDVLGRALLLYDRDWPGAEAAFRRAIAEAPSLAVAHNGYSILLQTLVRTDESLVAAAKAVELDPMVAWSWSEYGRALYRARRYADAEQQYRRALAVDPGFAPAIDRLGQLYVIQGRFPEARRMLAALERLPSSRRATPLRAWLAAAEGDAPTARRLMAGLPHPFRVHVALGDLDAAFVDLGRAADAGALPGFAMGNPELDPLRRDRRFAQLAAGLKLPVDALVNAPARPSSR